MREYETIYVLKPDLPPAAVQAISSKVEETIKKNQGHVLSTADWGKRKLAYRVDKFQQAQYFYWFYVGEGGLVAEVERILKYDDKILKFLTVKKAEVANLQERLAAVAAAPEAPAEYGEDAGAYGSGNRYGGGYGYGAEGGHSRGAHEGHGDADNPTE